jgi:hypothetical protein
MKRLLIRVSIGVGTRQFETISLAKFATYIYSNNMDVLSSFRTVGETGRINSDTALHEHGFVKGV